jgi:non-ribosomal peptide synthetase component E (peptide arylation enzyme)
MAKPTRIDRELIDHYIKLGYWDHKGLQDILVGNAKQYPDHEALVDPEKRLTWSELNKITERVAAGLLSTGIKRDQSIVGQVPRPVISLILLLACQKAGILCCLPPMTFRKNEMMHIIKRLEAVAVVTPFEYRNVNYYGIMKEIPSELPGLKYFYLTGDYIPDGALSFQGLIENPIDDRIAQEVLRKKAYNPFEVFMVVLSSGTTGMPKLIEQTGASSIAGGRGIVQRAKLTQSEIVGDIAPVSGGPGLQNWWAAFQVGAKVCTLPRFSPEDALGLIEKEKITYLAAIPTQIIRMIKETDPGRFDLSSLRVIRTGASSFDEALAMETEEKFNCRVLIAGGSQETYSFGQSAIDDPPEKRLGTLGRPFPGNEVKITDDNGIEVAQGEIGRLLVRGAATSSGYYNDPTETLKAWGTFGKEGWYDTGDLAKLDKEGYLLLTGRRKEIIVRGGQNIYPQEIEDYLLTHPKVSGAVVIKVPDKVMGERACACVTTRGHEKFRFDEMISFLKYKGLAVYKLPEMLELMESFPHLVDGQKVDKVALEKMILEKIFTNDGE